MAEPDHKLPDQTVFSCSIAEDFRAFKKLWDAHRLEAIEAMNKVNTIHKVITEDIVKHTSHLEKLDVICEKLDTFTSTLISAVTGKKQVSIWAFLSTVFILGSIVLVVLMRASNMELEISPSGLRIGSPTHNEQGK